jgi:hypothetical protein
MWKMYHGFTRSHQLAAPNHGQDFPGSDKAPCVILCHGPRCSRIVSPLPSATLLRRSAATQRELVAQLEREGHDPAEAKQLLEQFEEVLTIHVADRDRLLGELR